MREESGSDLECVSAAHASPGLAEKLVDTLGCVIRRLDLAIDILKNKAQAKL
jgi:hypothetical protein